MANLPSEAELLRIQLRTLYAFDRLGRIVRRAGDPERTPPRVAISSGGGERLLRVRHDVPEAHVRKWLACIDEQQFPRLVAAHSPVEDEYRGPAFVLPPTEGATEAEVITPRHVLHPELVARGWLPQERAPYVGVVRDGLVVSVCFCAAESLEAAEAGVETAASYRGQGLVALAVRAWANAVQGEGRLALYSTTWENEASRRVAAKLGAFEYGENWHLT